MNFGDFDEHAYQNLNLFTKAIPTSTKNYSKSKNTLALFVFFIKKYSLGPLLLSGAVEIGKYLVELI